MAEIKINPQVLWIDFLLRIVYNERQVCAKTAGKEGWEWR